MEATPCMTRNKSTHIKTINRPFPCEVAFPDTMRKRDAIDAINHVFGLKKDIQVLRVKDERSL